MYFWAQFFSRWKRVNCINFACDVFCITHMPYVEDFRFLPSAVWGHLKWRNVKKFSISPQLSYMGSWIFSTWQFFSTNNFSDISDKYQVCESPVIILRILQFSQDTRKGGKVSIAVDQIINLLEVGVLLNEWVQEPAIIQSYKWWMPRILATRPDRPNWTISHCPNILAQGQKYYNTNTHTLTHKNMICKIILLGSEYFNWKTFLHWRWNVFSAQKFSKKSKGKNA